MEFRDYAATETSALLGRLLSAQADGAVQHLRILREALDAAARAAEATAAEAPRAAQKEIEALAAKLGGAAAADRERVEQDAQAGLETARADLKAHLAENKKLLAALAEAKEQEENLRAAVQRETERADTADRDLDATIEAHKQVDAARIEAETAQRKEAHARAALETELRDLRGLLESTRTEASRLSDQLESEGAQNAVLAAEREAAAAECVALTAQLAAATNQFQDKSTQLDAAAAQYKSAKAKLEAVTAELEETRTRMQALEQDQSVRHATLDAMTVELGEARARVQALEQDRSAKDEEIRQLEGRLAERLGSEANLRDQAVSTAAELDLARAEVAAISGRTARLTTMFDASVAAFDELGKAGNVADLLASLVKQLATHFPRVALFRVKGNHVEGEHQLGFDMKADVAKLMIPLNVDSLITRAATSGAAAQLTGAEKAGGIHSPFGETPATALALPIGFQDETLAVAYLESDDAAADDGHAAREAGAAFATLLVRHTAVLVTRLSQELKMLAELREYASMLLQEADQMYTADVEAGKSDTDRRRRLQETIDCARQLYAQRAALEGAAAATLLDEQIAIQAASATPFARELASVAGLDQAEQSRRTAS